MAHRHRIFISSTYEDLQTHRSACIRVLNELRDTLHVDWVGMELFGGHTESPTDYSVKQVRKSDLFIGIVGARYGTIHPDTGRSISHLEYCAARERGIPCLMYVIDGRNAPVSLDAVSRGPESVLLDAFKKEVADAARGHTVRPFNSPEHIASLLATDITAAIVLLENTDRSGGLRRRIDAAMRRGSAFIIQMENAPSGGGWSYFESGISRAWDTACSLLALHTSGMPQRRGPIHRGQRWLINNRLPDGGWRSAIPSNDNFSNLVDTGASVVALLETGYQATPGDVRSSLSLIERCQRDDGGWAYEERLTHSTTAATAWCLRALARAGCADATLSKGINWLLATQQMDGGWAAYPGGSSTIGKTRDALMALFHIPEAKASNAIKRAGNWLLSNRALHPSSERFGAAVSVDAHGVNPMCESIIYLLEGAFYSNISITREHLRSDLEWLCAAEWWHYSPQATYFLSQCRPWVSRLSKGNRRRRA